PPAGRPCSRRPANRCGPRGGLSGEPPGSGHAGAVRRGPANSRTPGRAPRAAHPRSELFPGRTLPRRPQWPGRGLGRTETWGFPRLFLAPLWRSPHNRARYMVRAEVAQQVGGRESWRTSKGKARLTSAVALGQFSCAAFGHLVVPVGPLVVVVP